MHESKYLILPGESGRVRRDGPPDTGLALWPRDSNPAGTPGAWVSDQPALLLLAFPP